MLMDSVFIMYQVTTLTGHEDAVQTIAFDQSGEYLLSGGSDATVRIWS